MTFQTYNLNIPDAPNDPSVDQPNMQTNTNSIPAIIAIDHFAFGDNNGGRHKQVQLFSKASIPTGLIAGEGTLYVKQAEGKTSSESQLFYTPDAPGTPKEYQLTRCVNAAAANFGANNPYQPSVGIRPLVNGGWTFLPGGLLLQYGQATSATLNTQYQIDFPIVFSSFVSSVTLGPIRSDTTDKSISIFTGSIALAGFQLELSGNNLPTGVCWMAIGK